MPVSPPLDCSTLATQPFLSLHILFDALLKLVFPRAVNEDFSRNRLKYDLLTKKALLVCQDYVHSQEGEIFGLTMFFNHRRGERKQAYEEVFLKSI
jgi:hypothetical protein